MRRARTAVVVAAAILGGGGLVPSGVQAQPPEEGGEGGAMSGTVVLPTGDAVTVLPDGTAAIEPAEGREEMGFVTPAMLDGSEEIIAVPFDKVAQIEAGLEDPRLYNVTRLLEAGVSDAAGASAAAVDEREYIGLLPDTTGASAQVDEGSQQFSVRIRDRAGNVPERSRANWITGDGSGFGTFTFDENGVGSEALAPGEYLIVYEYQNLPSDTARGERLLGMSAVTVGEGPGELVVDSGAAQQVSAEVEREDAEYLGAPVVLSAVLEGEEGLQVAAGGTTSAGTDVYLMPEPEMPGFTYSFMYQPTFASPEGSDDPYTYNLALGTLGEYPDETAYSFTDDELAQVETHFQDLGAAVGGHTCEYGDFKEEQTGVGLCRFVPVEFPSTRTMFYTPGPEIGWDHAAQGGVYGEGTNEVVDGFRDDQREGVSYEAGQTERAVVNGGFGVGAPSLSRESHGDTDRLGGYLYPGFSTNGEALEQIGYEGGIVLSQDGKLIDESELPSFFAVDMPAVPGRYTLEAEAAYTGTTSDFATSSSQSWEFDLDEIPAEQGYEAVPLPVVGLSVEGAEGGWVEDDGPIGIELQAMVGEAQSPIDVASMTFEVSYDDGKTWRRVSIDRDGGTAEAELCPPRRAEFVSVRMTAVDTMGTEVSHTTIRSFGLD